MGITIPQIFTFQKKKGRKNIQQKKKYKERKREKTLLFYAG